MAFPDAALPVKVYISPGADLTDGSAGWVWTDITSSVRLRDGISITTGRPDEAARVDPSVCRMRLDNRTGNFTPRNPLGAYYGSLSRNTPLRVAIRRAEDPFDRTESNGLGTEPLWGGSWTTSGGSAADYSVGSGKGSIASSTASVRRLALLDIGVSDARVTVDVTDPVVATGASTTHWVPGRVVDASNFYAARLDVTTTGSVDLRVVKVSSGVTSTQATASAIGTHSAGDTWRIVFEYVGSNLRAKAWKPSGSEPSAWQVDTSNTDIASGTQVGVGVRLETGNTNGSVTVTWDDFTVDVDRFSGFVSAWPPRWDKSGNDASVPIEANGILRRLGQGNAPVRSPYRRSIASPVNTGLLAYWPGEDDSDAKQAASAIPGQPGMTVAGTVVFGDAAPALHPITGVRRFGTMPLPDLTGGGSLTGIVPASSSSPTEWAVQFFSQSVDFGSGVANALTIASWRTPGGTYERWELHQDQSAGGSTTLRAIDSAEVSTDLIVLSGVIVGPDHYTIDAIQNGANIDVRLWFAEFLEDSFSGAGTLTQITEFSANPDRTVIDPADEFIIGHIRVWDRNDPPLMTFLEVHGWSDPREIPETATDRLARLCVEDGVSLSIPTVDAAFETAMGLQPDGTALDLYQQCADADQGVLHEDGFGLGYVPRQHRYNRTVDLALDFDLGQVAEPPEPADDDQQLRNEWKVKRPSGSSATERDQDSVDRFGLYDDEVEVRVDSDSQLAPHAQWRVHLGTTDEMRWPLIQLNLAASPELIDDWLTCDVQSRVTAVNPPDEVAGDDIDAIIEGWTEFLGFKDWDVALNTSPASPWNVFVLEDPIYGRLDTSGSSLAASADSTETSLLVATDGGKATWINSTDRPGDFPFNVNCGGEVMRVTDISGATSPQSATVVRSINGVVKSHVPGTRIRLSRSAVGL